MKTLIVVLLVILLNGLFGWFYHLPEEIGLDVPEGKLISLSFAPFRRGQSPLKAIFPSAEEIEQDLRLLADKTHGIRTYASSDTMKPISKLAGKYGLQMIQGAWLGFIEQDNNKEVAALIESANTYPDVVKRVIVGNEILLRGEMKPEQLIEYIRKVKKAVKQPVSYADVWSMYVKYPELIKEVDYITIHILPYWEDIPISVNSAPQHIEIIYQEVKRQVDSIAPGKPILIGESGWPSQGRQRGWAKPSVVNEARFIRGFIETANRNGFDYNIIEAFNQPWKSELEGVVGGNWGLFSAEREQVFPLTGAVYENPDWYMNWLTASIIVLVLAGLWRKRIKKLTGIHSVVLIGLLQVFSMLLVSNADSLWSTSYSYSQQLNMVLILILNVLLSGLILKQVYAIFSAQVGDDNSGYKLYLLYFLIAMVAVYKTYGFVTHGRYLSFPSELTYIPVAGIIALILIHYIIKQSFSFQMLNINQLIGNHIVSPILDKLIGYVLVFSGMGLIYGETRAFMQGRDFIVAYPDIADRMKMALIYTLTNSQLLVWLLCLLVLAATFLFSATKNAVHNTEKV